MIEKINTERLTTCIKHLAVSGLSSDTARKHRNKTMHNMKNKTTTALLSLFLGGFGIHRFYLGQMILGIFYLVFCWTFIPAFVGFIDFIVFVAMPTEKFNLKYNSIQPQYQPKAASNISTEKEIVSISSKLSNNKNEFSVSLNEENIINLIKEKQKQRETEIKNFNYTSIIIQRKGIQLLESLSILNTTKNIDTLIGRFEFIEKMYDDFIKASYNQRYISDIQASIDQYKSMYYDRIINDFELTLIAKPSFENLIEYYSSCLFDCFDRYFVEQIEQIEQLKKEEAKSKRKEKILEIGNQTIFEYDKLDTDKNKLRLKQLKEKLRSLNSTVELDNELQFNINISNPIIINRNSSFELTLYNTSAEAVMKVVSILKDDKLWNKSKELVPLFSSYNIKCKEVDEYIQKYKPHYLKLTQTLINESLEYQEATDKDKEIIEREFKESILNKLPERAHCNLITLFDYSDIECSIDDRLVQKYGFENIIINIPNWCPLEESNVS